MSWAVPQWVAVSLFGLGWFVAIVLTYHEQRMEKVKSERVASSVSRTVLHPKRRLKAADHWVLENLNNQMRLVHRNDDYEGIRLDLLNGIDPNEILKRACTHCGKPRNQEGGHGH